MHVYGSCSNVPEHSGLTHDCDQRWSIYIHICINIYKYTKTLSQTGAIELEREWHFRFTSKAKKSIKPWERYQRVNEEDEMCLKLCVYNLQLFTHRDRPKLGETYQQNDANKDMIPSEQIGHVSRKC